jgi:hypothetical protein
MAPGRDPYAAGIVALALAFHRTPVAHPDLLHGRATLPAGVGTLLKLAGGNPPGPGSAALASPDELRTAALFFVEQVLLHHDASHYRVLGLEPGATLEQIKEHHRLLMRLFHPDRGLHADDWKDAFASRINLAYTTLHDAEARRRYDAALAAARPGMAPLPARRVHAKATHPRGAPGWLLRFLPQWVLAGTALLALGIVGAVYVSNPPLPAARDAALPRVSGKVGEAPPATASAAVKAPAVVVAETEVPPPPVAEPAPLGEPLTQPESREQPAQPALPERPAAAAPPRPPEKPVAKTPASAAPSPVPAPTLAAPAAAPAQAVPPVAAPAVSPAPLDPSATLKRFLSTYERGDTAGFMALFDEVAIGAAGGKPQIQREHEALFRSTELRHIAIDGMTWTQKGDWMRGEGRYRKTLMRRGELRLETEAGLIRIELLRSGDEALIVALDYQPGERS